MTKHIEQGKRTFLQIKQNVVEGICGCLMACDIKCSHSIVCG